MGWISEPSICTLTDGSYRATWMWYGPDGEGGGIFSQYFNSDGTTKTDVTQINTTSASSQYEPNIALLSDNSVVITWMSAQESGEWDFWGIYAQILDPGGIPIGPEFHINTYFQSEQIRPKSTGFENGGFATVWESWGQDGQGWGIAGRVFDSSGSPIGTDFVINDYTIGDQQTLAITSAVDNYFYVAWRSSDNNINIRKISDTGLMSEKSIVVHPPIENGSNWDPSILCKPNGDLVVVFNYRPTFETASASDIYMTSVSSEGQVVVSPFVVNTVTSGYQDKPRIVQMSDGQYAVFWVDSYNVVKFQKLGADFAKIGSEVVVLSDPMQMYDVQSHPDGGFALVYTNDAISKIMKFNSSGELASYTMIGSENSDLINGTGESDFIYGNGGNDNISSGSGDDVIYSGSGNDTISAGAGNDLIIGVDNVDTIKDISALGRHTVNISIMTGPDTFSGGIGNDTYVIDGGETVIEASNAGTDTVKSSITYTLGMNLEYLILSGSSAINGTGNALNNAINGNTGKNSLTGGAGNDTLNGGAGNDTLVGGAGNDTYVTDGGDTITESSGAGIDSVQSSATATLGANLENLTLTGSSAINGTGNTLNNTMTGNSSANTLNGGAGFDTLIGGSGKDLLTGAAGNDTFIFKNLVESAISATTSDVITDFVRGQDKIDLSAIDAFASSSANDTFVWKGIAIFNSTTKGEVRYQKFDNTGTANDYTMVWIDNDADTGVEMAIRLTGLYNLTASDFIL